MTIDLIDSERELLTRLLDQSLSDLRVEVRRTSTPDYHDRLQDEQKILKGVIEKVRGN